MMRWSLHWLQVALRSRNLFEYSLNPVRNGSRYRDLIALDGANTLLFASLLSDCFVSPLYFMSAHCLRLL